MSPKHEYKKTAGGSYFVHVTNTIVIAVEKRDVPGRDKWIAEVKLLDGCILKRPGPSMDWMYTYDSSRNGAVSFILDELLGEVINAK